MTSKAAKHNPERAPKAKPAPAGSGENTVPPEPGAHRVEEIGGRDGLDPTRYGDWEFKGRCIDF